MASLFCFKRNIIDKNYVMDWILLGVCSFCFVKGYFKGFVSVLFALIGTFVVAVLSWKLASVLSGTVYDLIGENLYAILKTNIDGLIGGEFTSLESFKMSIMETKYAIIFELVLSKLLQDVSFEGTMTAGEILAPSLCELLIKVISFVVIFVILLLLFKIFNVLLNKMVNFLGFENGNKILGGMLGAIKGVLLFAVFYVVVVAISNFTLNESLLSFVQSGQISKYLYENFTLKIINLFY